MPLATHTGILSSAQSTSPLDLASARTECSLRLYGLEKCEELVKEHTEAAIDALDVFADSEFMRELALSLVGREM